MRLPFLLVVLLSTASGQADCASRTSCVVCVPLRGDQSCHWCAYSSTCISKDADESACPIGYRVKTQKVCDCFSGWETCTDCVDAYPTQCVWCPDNSTCVASREACITNYQDHSYCGTSEPYIPFIILVCVIIPCCCLCICGSTIYWRCIRRKKFMFS